MQLESPIQCLTRRGLGYAWAASLGDPSPPLSLVARLREIDAFRMADSFEIRTDSLIGSDVANLLREHLASMALHSPPESVHALSLEALRAPEVTFWSVWKGSELAGCGALKELDPDHGEIKSMRTATSHLRMGVAEALLEHILSEARKRGYRCLSLETGSMAVFAPARALYARFGFRPCGPFADYVEDPYSVFMTREVDP